jgi:hypothetical protein
VIRCHARAGHQTSREHVFIILFQIRRYLCWIGNCDRRKYLLKISKGRWRYRGFLPQKEFDDLTAACLVLTTPGGSAWAGKWGGDGNAQGDVANSRQMACARMRHGFELGDFLIIGKLAGAAQVRALPHLDANAADGTTIDPSANPIAAMAARWDMMAEA